MGLRVMPLEVQPNLRAMYRELPPMPQPTSTICAGRRRYSQQHAGSRK